MTSYNLVNGVFMSENEELLQGLLRKEWGFQGTIVSDFEGIYSTVPSVIAGVALELPGPARFRGDYLFKAVEKGQITESQIDNLAKDVVRLAKKVGMRSEASAEEDIVKNDETATLVREIATEGIVLLKNENNLLPISSSKNLRIAVFGSPAAAPIIHGGGSASLTPSYVVSPLEALERKFGKENIQHHHGVPIFKKIPSAPLSRMTAPSNGQPGVDCYWYNGWTFENQIYHEILEATETLVIESRISQLEPKHCSRMKFTISPETTGTHTFGVTACGKTVLRVGDEVILEHCGFEDCRVEYVMQPGDYEVRADLHMKAGCAYEVTIDTLSTTAPIPSPIFKITPQATRAGFYENLNSPIEQDVTDLASKSDISIVFTANNKEYESESFDRSSLSLSPPQDKLVQLVAGAAQKSILINQTGSPIAMPWVDEVDSILQCWYAGQEVGNALVDILSGDSNPSGKLPVTFPRQIEDTPSFGNFPTDQQMKIRYEERLEMGYRARNKPSPLFPFGWGLSYTQFRVEDFALKNNSSASSLCITATATVINTGSVRGREVIQVYVDGVLKGFQKVFVGAGEERIVDIVLDKYAFSEWDPEQGTWVVRARQYDVDIRSDANMVIASRSHTIEKSFCWNGL
ncbi:hypothetical protein N7462_003348 [Penicillium macrosclerotiorum]|uniref:uncharacterized protein n=1 Tax=Penicillium macrosclerotiorum TaxID=303699 RepID=UPI0025482494|nr:uncharacterized protein N7462_003348 [Penicillium macrosclerotiorum]KAJ5688956.1 hypothetical protein N7462_003348 [Penicillium macrosclerotiorum]